MHEIYIFYLNSMKSFSYRVVFWKTVEQFFLHTVLKDLVLIFLIIFQLSMESQFQGSQHCGVVLCPQILELDLQSRDKFSKKSSLLHSKFPKNFPKKIGKLICHIKKK